MSELDLTELREFLRQFAANRDWEQYHTPKNLAMALGGEAGELLEVFQWLTPEESLNLSDEQRIAVADELVDILQYVVRIADVVGIDMATETWRKMDANARRYDVEAVRGSAKKR